MIPKFGQVWQHYKGGLYTTLGVAETEKGSKVVVYQAASGNLYTRLLVEWRSLINKQNGTRRFTLQASLPIAIEMMKPKLMKVRLVFCRFCENLKSECQCGARK